MYVEQQIFDDPKQLGAEAASRVMKAISAAAGRPFLLGCPGGRSATSTYMALAQLASDRDQDLSNVVVVMMDDYLVESDHGQLSRVDPSVPHSCERFGREAIVDRLNKRVSPAHRIPADHVWLPNPQAPAEYDRKISAAGGINLFILASGASDGHIAFNGPGADYNSSTRIVQLSETTRRDNLATFPAFGDVLDNVPRYGITVGIGTIRSASHSVLMVCHGTDKGTTVARLEAASSYEQDWPATILTECDNPHFLIDKAAAAAASLTATALK